ncbi:double-stranded RNA-binding protein 2-like [Chenopodium quinoa]|uniref:double-stranded RNA-binding protein 2-like n=1 Tax=Chenopodium quinoa TaxID=63459 RepID=UPI000B778DA1|nr:double-stranded RNA-binding protein 2-like [Chenopodium quinoa]
MYKNQLQELAQRSCFNLPSYACIREGPDHAPRFKASVNFNGEIFDSPAFFSTLRQAEHAAAEVALNTLADRGPSKTLAAKVLDETGVYKNLLQETAHRAGLNLPAYTTIRSGPGHVPVFSCTVELAGMTFVGEPAKTKKQAQKNAAIAAWSALKQMSQCGSTSSTTISGGHEEQEQVVVARFLASLNPAEPSNSSQSIQQRGHHRLPASTTFRSPFPSAPTSFGVHYQNWTSSNLPPEMASHHMWLQEQPAEQQRRLMALPIPIQPVPTPTQVVPWMHSMLQPSHHQYCLTREQQPVPLSPGISMCTVRSPVYFSNHIVQDPMKARSMVAIQEIQEEKPENSSKHCPPEPLKAPIPNSNSADVLNENLQKEAKQDSLAQANNVSSASVDVPENGLPTFESSRLPNIRFSHAATSNHPGYTGKALPTASQGVPVGPTRRNARTPITAPRMQSDVGSSVRPRFGRMQTGGFRSQFTAPAVQIRSVVPVCSAAPPRRTTSSTQKEESSDDTRNNSTGDVSIIKSKLGNLEI